MSPQGRELLRRFQLLTAIHDSFEFLFRFGREDPRAEVAVAFADVRGAVLDVAAGTAATSIRVATRRPDLRVVTLEPTRGMLAVADAKVRRTGLTNISLCRANALRLPFRDEAFAGVTASFALHELDPAARAGALDEIGRVAAPGAIVAIVDYGRPAGRLRRAVLSAFLAVFEDDRVAHEFVDYDLAGALLERGFGDLGMRHGRLAWRMVVGRKRRI